MLEKVVLNDKIEILEDGSIQVREVTRVLEDGTTISEKFTNRYVIDPGDDISHHNDERIRSICGVIHTEDAVNKFKEKINKARVMENMLSKSKG